MNDGLFANKKTKFLKPIGYDDFLAKYENLIENQKLPSTNLFISAKGSGKRILTEYLASLILDAKNTNYSELSMHPDMLIIENLDEKKQEITIDQTRKIKEFLSKTPSQARAKVIIIDSIDMLNKNASNSVLKVLEEPQKGNYFLLIKQNNRDILETIMSRSNKVILPRISEKDFFEILQNSEIEREKAELLYKIFPSQPGEAIKFINSNGLELLKQLESLIIDNNFLQKKQFAENSNFKEISHFNNFIIAANHLFYLKVIEQLSNFEINDQSMISLRDLQHKTINLNLDRKNFIMKTLDDLSE